MGLLRRLCAFALPLLLNVGTAAPAFGQATPTPGPPAVRANQFCTVGSFVTGADAAGIFSCLPVPGGGDMLKSAYDTDLDTEVNLAEVARALFANPAQCGPGTFVTDIAADGALTCATPPGGLTAREADGTPSIAATTLELLQSDGLIGTDQTGGVFRIGLDADLADLADGTLTPSKIGTGLTDAQVSDTLTASIFIGSGNVTNAVDLNSGEIAGILQPLNGGTGNNTIGSGVAAALVVNVGVPGSIVLNGQALGTPLSGTMTNLSGKPSSIDLGNATAGSLPLAAISDSGTANLCMVSGGAGDPNWTGCGIGASYITRTDDPTLSNDFAIGSLATGILFGTTGTGAITSLGADLPFANLTQLSANSLLANPTATNPADAVALPIVASRLVGRGPAGNLVGIQVAGTLTLSDTTLTATGGGTVTAREVDGSPSISASTIELLQSDGLIGTDQTGGVFRVGLDPDLADLADGTLTASKVGAGLTSTQVTSAADLVCTDCISGTEIAVLTDADISDTLTASQFIGSGSSTPAVDLETAEVAGLLPAANIGTGLTSTQVASAADVICTDCISGTEIAVLTDADVSDTLTASIFAGTGSTTPAVDLGSGEVSGLLADGNVSDTLTSSLFVGTGSTTGAVDLASGEVAGDLPFSSVQQLVANSVAINPNPAGPGDIQSLALAPNQLLGRGASGNVAAITLGTGLSMGGGGGTTLTATSATGTTMTDVSRNMDFTGEYPITNFTPASFGDTGISMREMLDGVDNALSGASLGYQLVINMNGKTALQVQNEWYAGIQNLITQTTCPNFNALLPFHIKVVGTFDDAGNDKCDWATDAADLDLGDARACLAFFRSSPYVDVGGGRMRPVPAGDGSGCVIPPGALSIDLSEAQFNWDEGSSPTEPMAAVLIGAGYFTGFIDGSTTYDGYIAGANVTGFMGADMFDNDSDWGNSKCVGVGNPWTCCAATPATSNCTTDTQDRVPTVMLEENAVSSKTMAIGLWVQSGGVVVDGVRCRSSSNTDLDDWCTVLQNSFSGRYGNIDSAGMNHLYVLGGGFQISNIEGTPSGAPVALAPGFGIVIGDQNDGFIPVDAQCKTGNSQCTAPGAPTACCTNAGQGSCCAKAFAGTIVHLGNAIEQQYRHQLLQFGNTSLFVDQSYFENGPYTAPGYENMIFGAGQCSGDGSACVLDSDCSSNGTCQLGATFNCDANAIVEQISVYGMGFGLGPCMKRNPSYPSSTSAGGFFLSGRDITWRPTPFSIADVTGQTDGGALLATPASVNVDLRDWLSVGSNTACDGPSSAVSCCTGAGTGECNGGVHWPANYPGNFAPQMLSILSTDCTAETLGQLNQRCVKTGGTAPFGEWYCKNPALGPGASAGLCDTAAEWAKLGDGGASTAIGSGTLTSTADDITSTGNVVLQLDVDESTVPNSSALLINNGAGTPAGSLNETGLLSLPQSTSAISIVSSGVRLTAANGALTVLGQGTGTDMNLILDLNGAGNKATLASNSTNAVTTLDAQTINLESDQLVSDATTASGLPPLIVASTNLVANLHAATADALNADLTLAGVAPIAANTVAANPTGSLADIQAYAMNPSTILGRGPGGNITGITIGTGLAISDTQLVATGTGAGDVVGPTGATLNGLARYSSTTGKAIKDSGVTLDDTGMMTFPVGGSVVIPAPSTLAGNAVTLNEKAGAGGQTWKIDLGDRDLTSSFNIKPEADGKLNGATLIMSGSLTATQVASTAGVAVLPDASSPTASGAISYDSTTNELEYGDNSINQKVANLNETQTLTNKTLNNATLGSPVINGEVAPTSTAVSIANVPSTLVKRDANGNFIADNMIRGYFAQPTLGGITLLTVDSANLQFFTGSGDQTVRLPDSSSSGTLVKGQSFVIVNTSTGILFLQTFTSNGVATIGPQSSAALTCINNTGANTKADWNVTGTIAKGTATMPTGNLTAGNCFTPVQGVADGVLTTDTIIWTPTADISGMPGYAPASSGGLIIYVFPAPDVVFFKVCNPTIGNINVTTAALLNWRVQR